jgi:hypothetical protein
MKLNATSRHYSIISSLGFSSLSYVPRRCLPWTLNFLFFLHVQLFCLKNVSRILTLMNSGENSKDNLGLLGLI